MDDNYVILCPICQSALSLKGKAKLGITPGHVWNEHVETGECQLKQNQRYQKSGPDGRATHCQSKGCKTKLTDVKYFKCPQCQMDLCLTHRFEDLHDCKPIQKNEMLEKIKSNNKGFNWKMKSSKKKDKDELSFGDKVLRFFVCCGPTDKKDKEIKKQ